MNNIGKQVPGRLWRPRISDRQKAVFSNWLAAYPVITILLAALDPVLAGAPLALRTLIVTIIMVPVMVYVAVPLVRAGSAKWLGGN